jgi:hypothetical protein
MTGPAEDPGTPPGTRPPGPAQAARDALAAVREARDLAEASEAATGRALESLQTLVRSLVEGTFEALPEPAAPPSEHRRAHRMGHPPKIDSDPELRAFVAARIDRMTFEALAAEIARHFPEPRRVRKSALHAWWKANRPR